MKGGRRHDTEKQVGRQSRAMDRPGVRKVQERSGEQKKMEEIGCEVCGAPTTPAAKGQVKVKVIQVQQSLFFSKLKAPTN